MESPRPSLRLVCADGPELDNSFVGLSPRMTLPEFFDAWFEPIVLTAEGSSPHTIGLYRDSMEWWIKLTKAPQNPPIESINEFTIRDFKIGLRNATYRRGKRGQDRPLSKFTISKHLKNVRTVLRRAGPTRDSQRPGKSLINEVPHIRVDAPRARPKAAFSIDQANRIVAATRDMPSPRLCDRWNMPTSDWWRGLVLVLFYTGLRIGTILKLRHDMLAPRHPQSGLAGTWLIIPGSIVDKTDKPLDKFLHPAAANWLTRMQSDRQLMFPWPHCSRFLRNRHELLQSLAGITPAAMLSPHAWRRAHGVEMARVGARRGIYVAQQALDHADARTTRDSYVDMEPELIMQLPRIDTLANQLDAERQRNLF